MAFNFSAVHNYAGDDLASDLDVRELARVFTWQRPEHQECNHSAGPTVAVKAGGQKRMYCEQCNLLINPNRPGKAATPSADFHQQPLAIGKPDREGE